jgi:hypothetical protein
MDHINKSVQNFKRKTVLPKFSVQPEHMGTLIGRREYILSNLKKVKGALIDQVHL